MRLPEPEDVPPELMRAALLFWGWALLGLSGSVAMFVWFVLPGTTAFLLGPATWGMWVATLYGIPAVIWGSVLMLNELVILGRGLLRL